MGGEIKRAKDLSAMAELLRKRDKLKFRYCCISCGEELKPISQIAMFAVSEWFNIGMCLNREENCKRYGIVSGVCMFIYEKTGKSVGIGIKPDPKRLKEEMEKDV